MTFYGIEYFQRNVILKISLRNLSGDYSQKHNNCFYGYITYCMVTARPLSGVLRECLVLYNTLHPCPYYDERTLIRQCRLYLKNSIGRLFLHVKKKSPKIPSKRSAYLMGG
jgi:hypothetical protein